MSKENWKNGDRVQKSKWVGKDEIISTGQITDVVTETRERKSYGYRSYSSVSETETVTKAISVKWDDGTEETGLSPWAVSPEDSALEREFRIKTREVQALIGEKLAQAAKALDEAEVIAEEHGISFSAGVSPLGQSYIAESASEKWEGVSEEFRNEITDTYGEYSGWQHSAVCY